MAKVNPWSQCCEGNPLSNEGIFMILLPHDSSLMIPYRLDTLQLKQEKEKSSVAQCSTA